MGIKSKALSSRRIVEFYYNGGLPDGEGEDELYRVHVTVATKKERLQIQAFSAEFSADGEMSFTAEDSKEAIKEASAKAQAKYFNKLMEYKRNSKQTPEEEYTDTLLVSHIQRINKVDGEREDDAMWDDENEMGWRGLDEDGRRNLIGEHPAFFAAIKRVVIPDVSEGVKKKSEKPPATPAKASQPG